MATTQAAAPAAKKAAPKAKSTSSIGIKDAIWVIVVCAIIAFCNFFFNLGQSSNFEGGDPNGSPLNIWGTIFKGGIIVPVIHTLLLTVLFMAVERVIALSKCIGKEKLATFVGKVKKNLKAKDFDAVLKNCDYQGGSVANVVRAAVMAYKDADAATGIKKEVKLARIQQAHEEAIAVLYHQPD